ncbi:ion transport peptide isoform X2 [Lasioglossum baleicum]|uniref:ion transport peptide isoform X2 n=1 Tax=Lasioglossum baleicum TaxID=434251 RepID=UPI003FCC90F0
MAPCEKGKGDSKQGRETERNRGAAITRRFSGQLEGVVQKGVLPEREGRAHGTPAETCILDAERRDAWIRRILFVVSLLPFKEENNIKTMHRQQRLRSPSSSPSLQSLPRVSPSRPSATSVLLSPASTSTSTSTSALTPTPRSIASTTGPTSSIALPTSSTWSTSKLSPFVWDVQQTSCSSLALLSKESSILTSSSSSSSALSSPPPSSSFTIPLPVPCPRLVSVLAWSMTLLLVTSCIGLTDAGILNGHPLGKRSFIDIQCKGIYDKSIFARLDRICEDCYNLFREPQLHQLCRQSCFGTQYFTSCIQALLLEDEKEKFEEMADYLGRKK